MFRRHEKEHISKDKTYTLGSNFYHSPINVQNTAIMDHHLLGDFLSVIMGNLQKVE